MSGAEAIRAYIVTLRKGRGVTLDAMADAIKMPRRTYIEWEQGRTRDIKTPFAVRAVQYLHGSLSDLARIDQLSEEEAADLANTILSGGDDSRRESAVALIDELLSDPEKYWALMGYGQRLLEERSQSGDAKK